MRRLLVSIVLVACSTDADPVEPCGDLRAAGVFAPCTPPPDDLPAHAIMVRWSFYPMVGGPESSTCRPGVANVELHTSDGGFATYPCADRSGPIDVGVGELWLARLVDANGTIIAESVPKGVTFDVEDARFYEDGGFARVTWDIQLAGGQFHMKCLEEEALRMTILSAGTQVSAHPFPCHRASNTLISDALREGTYTFVFEGLNGSETATIAIGRNNAITDLAVTTP